MPAFLLIFVFVVFLTMFVLEFALPSVIGKYKKVQTRRVKEFSSKMEDSFIFWEKKKLVMVYLFPLIFGGLGLVLLRHILGFALGFALGIFFPQVLISLSRQKRISEFRGQLVDGLLILSSSLKAGLSFLQAMEVLCQEMPAPISQEFNLILTQMKLGVSMEDALKKLKQRVPIEEINLIVTSILISRESGGDLPNVLSRLVNTIRDNLKLKEKISTLTLQGRLQGIIMMALPFLFVFFIYKNNPGHFDVMLQTQTGRMLLGVAAVLQVVGMFMIQKISTMRF